MSIVRVWLYCVGNGCHGRFGTGQWHNPRTLGGVIEVVGRKIGRHAILRSNHRNPGIK